MVPPISTGWRAALSGSGIIAADADIGAMRQMFPTPMTHKTTPGYKCHAAHLTVTFERKAEIADRKTAKGL